MALVDFEMPVGFTPAAAKNAFGRSLAGGSDRELSAAIPLAPVGILALVALPGLMVVSLLLSTPLAFPAMLATGFMAVAWALWSGRRRAARALTALVLSGMVAAVGCTVLLGTGAAAYVVSLLVPMFAAAPGGLHVWERRRRGAKAGAQVKSPVDVTDVCFPHVAIQQEADSIAPSVATASPVLQRVAAPVEMQGPATWFVAQEAPDEAVGETSVVADAMGFALKLLAVEAARRPVTLVPSCDENAAVRCERRALRQIIRALGAEAIRCGEPESEIKIAVRNLKGAVLLRVGPYGAGGPIALRERPTVAAAAGLVADAGGTLLCECDPNGDRISVRLPRVAGGQRECRPVKAVGVAV